MNEELIKKVNDDIFNNGDYKEEMYYQLMCIHCEQLERYFEKYNVINPLDKIYLAQHWGRFDLAKIEFKKMNLEEYQKSMLKNISNVNGCWYETLNPQILNKKYDFLKDKIEFISTDMRTQELLLSLNEEELNLFKKMYLNLLNETSNVIPYICRILDYVGESIIGRMRSLRKYDGSMFRKKTSQFKNLSHDLANIEISPDILDKIIYIFTNNNIDFNVQSLKELQTFDFELSKYINDSMKECEKSKSVNNIENLKSLVLLRCYGIELDYAKFILDSYNLNGIDVGNYNQSFMSIYESITHIVEEQDVNKLLEIYNTVNSNSDFKLDYMCTTLLEDGLRNIFLKHLNEETFKCNKEFKVVDGVKIYDAGIDFKIILTSVGAYQPKLGEQLNYYGYWNNNQIRSHGNCCSLVANNNLSTASIRNICLGFSNFPEGSLLLSSAHDLNSTPTSREINSQDHYTKNFMSINNLIDNTRSDYNELVFERRNLSKDRTEFKKNPDYIVFFEEFENILDIDELDENAKLLIKEQKRIYEISMKAAKDFNVPLVVINREKCARNEITKIEAMVNEYKNTKNPFLINRIITEYENNRTGLRDPHRYLRDKYFSDEKLKLIIKEILITTNTIESEELKNKNLEILKNVIDFEISKYKKVKDERLLHFNQESGLIGLDIDELNNENMLISNGGINL